jgi:hypothetical protein
MLNLFDHQIRKKFSLSLNEYGILSEIYWLSHNVKYGGWCIASKDRLSKTLDLTRDTIFRAIKKLTALGLVEKGVETNALRTTDLFNNSIASDTPSENQTATILKSDTPSENQTATILKSDTGLSENQTQAIQEDSTIRENKKDLSPKSTLGINPKKRFFQREGTRRYMNNIFLTVEEYQKLCKVWQPLNVYLMMQDLDAWLEDNPNKKKNHYLTLGVWFRRKKDYVPDSQLHELLLGKLKMRYHELYVKNTEWKNLQPTDHVPEENQGNLFGNAPETN